jgi:hypothetical protein
MLTILRKWIKLLLVWLRGLFQQTQKETIMTTPLSIEVPFPVFQDRDGQPLENGYVWLGVANLNPQTNPVIAYFDKALTIPAAQPLRTINGYISNAGTPAQVYVDGVNFSILVQDSKGSMVYNFPEGTGISPDACGVIYDPPFTGAVAYPVCEKLEQTVSVKDFGAVGDGVTDDTAAIQAAFFGVVATRSVFFPAGDYIVNAKLFLPAQVKIYGEVTGIGTNEGRGATIRAGNGLSDYIIENYSLTLAPTDPWAHGTVIEGIQFQNNAAKTANGINLGPAGDCSRLSRLKFTGFPIGIRTSGSGLPATSAEVSFSIDTISLYACEIGILFDGVANSASIDTIMLDGNTVAGIKFDSCGFTFHCNITQVHIENLASDKVFWAVNCSNSCIELMSVDVEFASFASPCAVVYSEQPTAGLNPTRIAIRDIVCASFVAGQNILVDTRSSTTISATDIGWASYLHNMNAYYSGTARVFGAGNSAAGNWQSTFEIADAATGGNVATIGSFLGTWYKTIAGTTTVIVNVNGVNLAGLTAGNPLYVRGLPVANNANFASIGSATYSTPSGAAIIQARIGVNQSLLTFLKSDGTTATVASFTTGGNLLLNITYFNSLSN